MAKRNTDTVKTMLTPGEFVITRESAKKIGYGNLDRMNETGEVSHMNKGGKVKTKKKEAKMPQGIGTYGSKVGRPPKKNKGYQYGGRVPPARTPGTMGSPGSRAGGMLGNRDNVEFDEDMQFGGKVKTKKGSSLVEQCVKSGGTWKSGKCQMKSKGKSKK